jgi:hypothetical protein
MKQEKAGKVKNPREGGRKKRSKSPKEDIKQGVGGAPVSNIFY